MMNEELNGNRGEKGRILKTIGGKREEVDLLENENDIEIKWLGVRSKWNKYVRY